MIALAITLAATAVTAMGLGIAIGRTKSKLTRAETERDALEIRYARTVDELSSQRDRFDAIIRSRDQELEGAYAEIQLCGDDASRGRAASIALRRLLTGSEATGDTNDDSGLPN